MRCTKTFLSAALGALACLSTAVTAQQDFPARPLHMFTMFAAGSQSDLAARFTAGKLTEQLGVAVIVENRGGAGGLIGARETLRTQPLGYSLLFAQQQLVGNLVAYKDPQYKLEDFATVGVMGITFYALIFNTTSVPSKTLSEFVAFAKANPGKLNYGSLGPSTGSTILAERFKQAAGIDMVMVPFKGGDPVAQALLANDVQVYFATLNTARTRMRNANISGLAVTAERRSQILPDLPTFKENGYPGIVLGSWSAVMAPSSAPAAILQKLKETMVRVKADPATIAQLQKQEIEPWTGTTDEFTAYIKAEGAALAADYKRLKIPVLD